jgi:tryptophan synthase alpha chain
MFARLQARGEIAFIPFAMVGDPDPGASEALIEALVAAGADALELGIPFSDPIADGPTIQAAATRALSAGVRPAHALELIARVRARHPDLPIGLLVYANLLMGAGVARFYARCAEAGVDSVLVADVPTREAPPFTAAARAVGVHPVLIATPDSPDATLAQLAMRSSGYTYVVTRAGVTGARDTLAGDLSALVSRVRAAGAPPPVLGFGISRPDHVRAARAAGAAGAISGSAVVSAALAGGPEAAAAFVRSMKAAT